ncbi:Vesicle transport protein [Aphelenchoides besseyi]|nr:Vesicle transport protein [Aphelenchoides besseyi]
MFDRFRRSAPADLETQSTQGIIEEETAQLSGLSYETRLYCFAGCLILSILTSILGSPFMFVGKFAEFAVLTSLGAMISIGGTFFSDRPQKAASFNVRTTTFDRNTSVPVDDRSDSTGRFGLEKSGFGDCLCCWSIRLYGLLQPFFHTLC